LLARLLRNTTGDLPQYRGLSASWENSMNNRHVASDVLHDLITSILVAVAAVIASGLLERVWDAFERAEAPILGRS
jgi:hypothetical protein